MHTIHQPQPIWMQFSPFLISRISFFGRELALSESFHSCVLLALARWEKCIFQCTFSIAPLERLLIDVIMQYQQRAQKSTQRAWHQIKISCLSLFGIDARAYFIVSILFSRVSAIKKKHAKAGCSRKNFKSLNTLRNQWGDVECSMRHDAFMNAKHKSKRFMRTVFNRICSITVECGNVQINVWFHWQLEKW